MGVRGSGLVATLAAIWFALAAVPSVQAASVSNSILVGGYARPVLMDPSTGKVRKLPAFNAAREETALRTTDGRALITAYQRAGAAWVERYSLMDGNVTAIGPFAVSGSESLPWALSPDGREVVTVTRTSSTVPGTNIGSDGPIRVDRLDLDALTAMPLIGPIPRSHVAVRATPRPSGSPLSASRRWAATCLHPSPPVDADRGAGGGRALPEIDAHGAHGSGARSVADLAGDASDIAWSPDSRRIAAGTTNGLRIVDVAASTPPVNVTSGPTDGASFSSSGRFLAYVPLNATGRGKLRILDLKTRTSITVAKLGFAGALSWAPKQDVIAVCAGKRYNTLYRVSGNGTAKELSSKYCRPVWGPTPGP